MTYKVLKIRVSTFKDGKIFLNVGDKFILDAELPKGEGNQEAVGLDYKHFHKMLCQAIFFY